MRPVSGMVITLALFLVVLDLAAQDPFDPHGDPDSGVLILTTVPSTRGECEQCHRPHADSWGVSQEQLLFTENDNRLAFWDQGDGPCHQERADNYPLQEVDRIPETEPDAGYFEACLRRGQRFTRAQNVESC